MLDFEGWSVLHHAAWGNCPLEVFEVLCEHFDVNLVTKANHSVMMVYLFCKKERFDPAIVRLLLRKGFETEMLDSHYR